MAVKSVVPVQVASTTSSKLPWNESMLLHVAQTARIRRARTATLSDCFFCLETKKEYDVRTHKAVPSPTSNACASMQVVFTGHILKALVLWCSCSVKTMKTMGDFWLSRKGTHVFFRLKLRLRNSALKLSFWLEIGLSSWLFACHLLWRDLKPSLAALNAPGQLEKFLLSCHVRAYLNVSPY